MEGDAVPAAAPLDVDAMLAARNRKDQLRFVICGSVDDGKSTLLGRLLYDTKNVFEDQLSAVAVESRTYGTRGDAVDLALLVDGLQAEREQGITIDVAYRYFETGRRRFTAIDAPGHEQYTRNMATGASKADAALVLVDVRKGVRTQTRRHSRVVSLMGIRRAILAVNKMDLVDYDRHLFCAVVEEYRSAVREMGFEEIGAVPISALTGENVRAALGGTSWYDGPPLLELLETVEAGRDETAGAFRMPVQWINRPHGDFRGFSGTVASGQVERGMGVVASLSGRRSTVERILGPSGDLDRAVPGQAVTLVLADDIDIGRGDTIADADSPPGVANQFAAHLIWMDTQPMLPERSYAFRFASASGFARVTDLAHRIDARSQERLAARTLGLNEIGYGNIAFDRAVPFDPYSENRRTGGFVLVDRFTHATVGAGMIHCALRRARNSAWQETKVDKAVRSRAMDQRPCILWMTGLSGAGKSTIARRLEQKLQGLGRYTCLLDGDHVRRGLNRDLGFSDEDRVENIRRIAEVGKLMVDAGLIVIVAVIAPFRAERLMARALVAEGEFVEIHVDAPLEVCEARDPKGLYAKARRGERVHFTGIDSPYEPPQAPELRIDTTRLSVDAAADAVIGFLQGACGVEVRGYAGVP